MERQPAVYILAHRPKGVLYTGVTSHLSKRIWEHKINAVEGFSRKYGIHMLVWYELHPTMESAISKEKSMKKWKRAWKLRSVEKMNAGWKDLSDTLG